MSQDLVRRRAQAARAAAAIPAFTGDYQCHKTARDPHHCKGEIRCTADIGHRGDHYTEDTHGEILHSWGRDGRVVCEHRKAVTA